VTTLRARWKLVVAGVVAVTLAAVVLALTAWASSDSSSQPPAAGSEEAMLEFARCMRENGVPSFPDPVAQPDGSFGFPRPQDVPTDVMDDALASCQSQLEATGLRVPGAGSRDPAVEDAILDFSRCMRENGVPEFPDPQPGAGFHGLFEGIDQQSPRVQRAIASCRSILSRIFGPSHG
jgi:hypothetical protein